MPQKVRKCINWEQTRREQGPWPRQTMLSMRFENETGLIMMIEILKLMSDELDKANFCVNGERVETNLGETSDTSSGDVLQRTEESRRR